MLRTKLRSYVIGEYLPGDQIRLVNHAQGFAMEAHAGQRRASGEPFVEHPMAVAQILSGMRLDGSVLAAALLHDVVEDTHATLGEIQHQFGPEVACLVDGVTKATSCSCSTDCTASPDLVKATSIADLAKLIRAIDANPQVGLIRLADRLHNMRTLSALSWAKQRRIARETLAIYVPLAHSLGVAELRDELQRLALFYLLVTCNSPQISHLLVKLIIHLLTYQVKHSPVRDSEEYAGSLIEAMNLSHGSRNALYCPLVCKNAPCRVRRLDFRP